MNDDIVVIDNVIPEIYQKQIFDIVSGKNFDFPYYYFSGTGIDYGKDLDKSELNSDPFSLIERKKDVGVFIHRLIADGKNNSDHAEAVLHPFKLFKDRIDRKLSDSKFHIDFDKLTRLQANLLTERRGLFPYHTPWHVDQEFPHMVMIYYVVDCDGKTLFKNGKSVKPKRGRCVIFNGELRHSLELSKNYRLALNFNFVL